ncbi:MAG: DUF3052 domain-containing protein [Anaerolineae bacterium]
MPDKGSTKPLADKLGLRPGMEIAILNAPDDIDSLLGAIRDTLTIHQALPSFRLEWLQVFAETAESLDEEFPRLVAALQPNGQLWISWRKGQKSLGSLNENLVRDSGLTNGVVDVKVVSVNEVWSGLKFVIRLRDRETQT